MNFSLNVASQCLRQAVSCFINHNSLCFVSKHLKIDIFIFIDVQSCCDTFKHSSDIFSRVELRFAWTSRLDASQRRLSIWVNPVKYIHKIQDCLTILIHFLFTFNYFIFWFRLIYFSLRNFSHSFLLFICEPVFLSMIYDKYFFSPVPFFSFYNTMEPYLLWNGWPSPEKRSTSTGEKEDCQRRGSQFIGELTVGFYYTRCKCVTYFRWLHSVTIHKWTNTRSMVNHNHESNSFVNDFSFLSCRWQMPMLI